MDKKQLGEAYAAKATELEALLGKEDLTAEDIEAGKVLEGELAGLKQKLELAASAESLRTTVTGAKALLGNGNAPQFGEAKLEGVKEAGHATVLDNELIEQHGTGLIGAKQWKEIGTKDYDKALRELLRVGGHRELMDGDARKALQAGIDTDGGQFIQPEYINRLIAPEATPTRVSGLVTTLTTSKDTITMPKVVYTSDDLYSTGARVTWTGEIPSSSTVHRTTAPVFGTIRIPVYTAMISIALTKDLLEDSSFDVMAYMTDKFRETVMLLKDNMILNGNGVGQPDGLLMNPGGTDQPEVVVSGAASSLLADGLINTKAAIPEQYEGNAKWLFNKSTEAEIYKIKDGNGRYMFDQLNGGIVNPSHPALLNDPYIKSAFMPDTGSNAFPIIYGDFAGYTLVNRIGFSIQVLNELYAETNQVVILGRVRFGGRVTEPWRLKVHKCATS